MLYLRNRFTYPYLPFIHLFPNFMCIVTVFLTNASVQRFKLFVFVFFPNVFMTM